MWDSREMRVTGQEKELMLHGETGNPEIVGWNGGARAPELNEEPGINFCGLEVRVQHADAWSAEKNGQNRLVVPSASRITAMKPCSYLGCRDEWNPDLDRFLHPSRHGFALPQRVRQPIGVEEDPHFQRSGSMRRCSSRIRSNSGSSRQRPGRSFKERYLCPRAAPADAASSSTSKRFKLIPRDRALRRKTRSTSRGTPRTVYWAGLFAGILAYTVSSLCRRQSGLRSHRLYNGPYPCGP